MTWIALCELKDNVSSWPHKVASLFSLWVRHVSILLDSWIGGIGMVKFGELMFPGKYHSVLLFFLFLFVHMYYPILFVARFKLDCIYFMHCSLLSSRMSWWLSALLQSHHLELLHWSQLALSHYVSYHVLSYFEREREHDLRSRALN